MDRMKEFKDQAVDELKALFHDLTKEIYDLKSEISTTRKIDKPHLMQKKKRNRARVLTLLAQKSEKI